jgi:hypothetical protein
MAHTAADYSGQYRQEKVYGNIDNAELVARLNGLSTMDRRGNVIWLDDFEQAAANKWDSSIDGAGTMSLSADCSWMGNQSMKTVTDVNLADDVIMEKRFVFPVDNRVGVEFMYHIRAGKPTLRLYLAGYNGTSYFGSEIRYIHNTGVLSYWDGAGNYITLPRYDYIQTDDGSWCYIKLVIDTETMEYVRLIFGAQEYDLSGIPMRNNADATERLLVLFIYNRAGTAAASTVYFDNVILTQNEP